MSHLSSVDNFQNEIFTIAAPNHCEESHDVFSVFYFRSLHFLSENSLPEITSHLSTIRFLRVQVDGNILLHASVLACLIDIDGEMKHSETHFQFPFHPFNHDHRQILKTEKAQPFINCLIIVTKRTFRGNGIITIRPSMCFVLDLLHVAQ